MSKGSTGVYPECQKHGISPETIDKDLPEVEHPTNASIVELNSIILSQNYTWQKKLRLDTSSAGKEIPNHH